MLIHNPIFTGSISLNGADISQISTVSSDSSSFASRITSTESTASAFISASGSLSTRVTATEATASALVTASGSLSTRVTAAEATASAYVTASGSLSARIASNEARTGSFATTGSNYFIGTQVITGSVYITSDLIVQGSSSLQNITASAVSIGTNTVVLNTSTPILRFGGISVQDSGSAQGRSGSLWWDSLADHWIYVVPSGSAEGYNSAMLMNGPKNTGSLGSEAGLTTDYIPVSQGEDHITDSIIFQSGSRFIGIGTNIPTYNLHVKSSIDPTELAVENTTTGGTSRMRLINATRSFILTNNATDNLLSFNYDGSNRLQFNTSSQWFNSGNVGIGTTNPGYTLDVSGTGRFTGTLNANGILNVGSDLNINRADSDTVYTGAQIWLSGTYTGIRSGTDHSFNIDVYNSGGSRTNALKITQTGTATFASSITATSLSISSTSNSTNPGSGAAVISGGMGVNGDIFLHQASANGANYGYIKTNPYTVNTTQLILGTTYGYNVNVDALTIFNGAVGINQSLPSTKLHVEGSATTGTVGTEAILTLGRALTSGTSFQNAASFNLGRYSTTGGSYESYTRLDIALKSNSTSSNYTADTTVMTLTNQGRVGIGSTAPIEILDVTKNGNQTDVNWGSIMVRNIANYAVGNDASIGFALNNSGNTNCDPRASIGCKTESSLGGALVFNTRLDAGTYTEKMRVTGGGSLLVGTQQATAKITIGDGAKASNSVPFAIQTSDANQMMLVVSRNINLYYTIEAIEQNVSYRSIYFNLGGGGVYAGTQRLDNNSDIRVKENIQPVTNALDTVMSLSGKKFNMIDEDNILRYGFIAQEVQPILNDFVTESTRSYKDGENVIENLLTIESSGTAWAALLVEAIKELKSELNTANQKIAALEAQQ